MANMDVLRERLRDYASNIIGRRLDCLEKRKPLFPWLRAKWLMRKFSIIEKFLG